MLLLIIRTMDDTNSFVWDDVTRQSLFTFPLSTFFSDIVVWVVVENSVPFEGIPLAVPLLNFRTKKREERREEGREEKRREEKRRREGPS